MEDASDLDILERLRQASGATTDNDMALRLGLSRQSVAKAKATKSVPSSWIPKAAKLFNVTTDWLFFGKGPMRPGEQEPQTLLPKSEVARRLIAARAQEVSAPEEPASTGGSAPPAPSTLMSCARCAKLEKRLEMAEEERRQASDKLVEALQANVALVTELGEQKLENMKLSQQLEAARQMRAEHSLKGLLSGDSAVPPSAPSAPSHARPNK